jgi:hypothetical protein
MSSRHAEHRPLWTAALGAAMIFAVSTPAQDPNFGNQELPQGAEALTRGPVHEAFAAPVVFNPTAGVIAVKSPPAPIEELPPDQKPEGDIVWIPGYWSWDEERQDYIWISGIWRDPPPGMTWVPGYWVEVDGGFDTEEVEYLPEPPQSLENGPNVPQPDDNHFWIPGTYVWRESRYYWQPGYWTGFQPGWVWVPARYHWTPTGYVYTAGYWDVPMEVRGVMFAPVYFTAARPVNYYYTPAIVLNVGAITTHLFCRPHHHVYVFGDFYEDRYVRAGYTPWFEFGRTRYGYDPNFVYYRHHFHRTNPDWAVTLRRNYDFIRRDPSYRAEHYERQHDRRQHDGQQCDGQQHLQPNGRSDRQRQHGDAAQSRGAAERIYQLQSFQNRRQQPSPDSNGGSADPRSLAGASTT